MDRFSFEYKDSANDIKIKMTFEVSNIIQSVATEERVDMFKIDAEFWHAGVKYNKDEFAKHINDKDFDIKNDFGLGCEFGFFCGGIIKMLRMRSAAAKNPEIVQNLRGNIN